MSESDESFAFHEQQLNFLLERARGSGPSDHARLRISALPKSRSSIAYFEFGDPRGAPLVCLHGLSITGLFFEQYHAYFVENGIRAIAPCLLGGIYVPDSAKTIDGLASELIELLDQLGVAKFDLIGFSWGTLAELALLARVPDRVRRAGLLGPMLPSKFLVPADIDRLKSDVRLSLKMVGEVPRLHRCLMWLICRLPVSVLVDQFRDKNLSVAEADALAPGTVFHQHLSRCIDECRRTGSRFFTDGWRMFLDDPGYALSDLSSVGSRVDVRLYVGELDNVHPPSFAQVIAQACSTTDVGESYPSSLPAHAEGAVIFRRTYVHERCTIWTVPGAGRMACMLYFKDALDNLTRSDCN